MKSVKVSPHFSRHEFACECGCGFDPVDAELVMILENIRSYFDYTPLHQGKITIKITGPNRCLKHNTTTKGASPNSMHTKGMAVDFKVLLEGRPINQDMVADLLERWFPDRYGIGRYHNRTHLDVRPTKARWDNR